MFQLLILITRRVNILYHHWGCTRIHLPLSYSPQIPDIILLRLNIYFSPYCFPCVHPNSLSSPLHPSSCLLLFQSFEKPGQNNSNFQLILLTTILNHSSFLVQQIKFTIVFALDHFFMNYPYHFENICEENKDCNIHKNN